MTQLPPEDLIDSEEEISLLALLMVLAKNKATLLKTPLIAGIAAAVISLVVPNYYTASTKILPPQQSGSSASALLSQLGGLASIAGAASGIKNPNDLYLGMLKSRAVQDNLIERFALQDRYGEKLMTDTRLRLEKETAAQSGKDGIITIEFTDRDPKFAAEVTNAYVEELYKLTGVLAVTEASQRRLFYERQLQQVQENLNSAQLAAGEAISASGLANIDAQGKGLLETSARIRAQISAKEIQIGSMRAFAGEQNPQLKLAQQELSALKSELGKLEGTSAASENSRSNKQGFENLQLVRNVKYYETMYELIAKQYELAKLDEAKNASLIQVLDKAVEPDKKSKPKRALIVLLTMVATGFLTILWIFMRESLNKTREDPDKAAQLDFIKSAFSWRKPKTD